MWQQITEYFGTLEQRPAERMLFLVSGIGKESWPLAVKAVLDKARKTHTSGSSFTVNADN